MSRQTAVSEVKAKCPAFKDNRCPYTGLKDDFAESAVFDHGCIVNPGQCKTLGDVTDVLASLVPKDENGKKIMAHAIQKAVLLQYNEEKKTGVKSPVQPWPFNTDKDGKPVIGPQSAIDSVYVKMDDIKAKCPVFEGGKACPYNVPALKGLAAGCPEFKNGCPFKNVKDIGEWKEKMGKMRDACKGKEKYDEAFKIIVGVNEEQVAKHGNCPFFQYGCLLKDDLQEKPISTDFVQMDYIKENCPVFHEGRYCPYNIPCLKGLGKGCPEFKNGCPFKDVKTIGEFKAKLGQMRDQCKGVANYSKSLAMIGAVNGEETAKFGRGCPFFKFGCMLSTDESGKPIARDYFKLNYIKEHCPAFQKGKFCPYNVPELKGLGKGCPAFKNGCPFKGVRTVGDFKGKLGEMRDVCKGKAKYDEALKIIESANGKQVAKLGHCPFFKFGCPLKTDREGKPIVPENVTMEYIQNHCPVFEKGSACPYNVKELKGLAKDCPEFKKGGCPFKDVKTVGDFKTKMGEMRDTCKGKAAYSKALDLAYSANGQQVAKHGHCPFFKGGCCLKTDMNGRFVTPENITFDYIKQHCAAFDHGKKCPYKSLDLKGLGQKCPAFKEGCPFKSVKDVGEFQGKLGEMRDQCKGKENCSKALEKIKKASVDEAANIGHCPFHHGHCELKTDQQGKRIV